MSINNVQANQVKKSVLKVAGRFQKLDETPADVVKDNKDSVFVRGNNPVDLPKSTGNQLARLAVGALAPKEEDVKAVGSTTAKDGKLESAHVVTTSSDGKESVYQFRKLDDGTQIFHGPTESGYAVVKENKDGTLTMVTSEGPNEEAYWQASKSNGAAEQSKSPETAAQTQAAPKTFAETLREMASGQQATGPGTVASRGSKKPEVEDSPAPASDDKAVPAQAPTKPPGFMAPFGQPAKAESAPQETPGVLEQVGDSLKEAGEKAEEKSKSIAQSVKDWSQSDTGQSVGDLLFGIANPWKKKKG